MRKIEITEQNAHYWHRRLWDWLAKHPGALKSEWPGWKYFEDVLCDCFACEIGEKRLSRTEYSSKRCSVCPVSSWTANKAVPCDDEEFGAWREAAICRYPKRNYHIRTKLAETIRDLELSKR